MTHTSPLIPVLTGRQVQSRTAGPFEVTLVEHVGDLRLARHCHREAVIGLLMHGAYEECLEGRTVEPGPASLLIKPPETPHANRIGRTGTHTVLIQVLPDAVPPELAGVLGRPAIHVAESIWGLGEMLLRELTQPDAGSRASMEALVFELLGVAQRRAPHRGTGYSRRQQWVGRVRDLMHDARGLQLSLTEIAAAVGVDRAHLARTFRAVFGCTIGEYGRAARAGIAAARLRETDDSLARIAHDAGYFDQAHLTRNFTRAFGARPSVYRRQRRLAHVIEGHRR